MNRIRYISCRAVAIFALALAASPARSQTVIAAFDRSSVAPALAGQPAYVSRYAVINTLLMYEEICGATVAGVKSKLLESQSDLMMLGNATGSSVRNRSPWDRLSAGDYMNAANGFLAAVGSAERAEIERMGCEGRRHEQWLANAEKFLSDPRLAGNAETLIKARCDRTRLGQCGCFATAFDRLLSVGERSEVLDATDNIRTFRKLAGLRSVQPKLAKICGGYTLDERPIDPNRPDLSAQSLPIGDYRIAGRLTNQNFEFDYSCKVENRGDGVVGIACNDRNGEYTGTGRFTGQGYLNFNWNMPIPSRFLVMEDGRVKSVMSGAQMTFASASEAASPEPLPASPQPYQPTVPKYKACNDATRHLGGKARVDALQSCLKGQ